MDPCDKKNNYVAYLIYKDAKTRAAVEGWLINTITWPLAAHEESGSDKSPGQNTHRSNNRPVRVIGEGLFNGTRRGDRETSERVQRDCSDKCDDPPREENQGQGHHNTSPLLGFVQCKSVSMVEWTHRKHNETFTTHIHHSSLDISFITEEGNYRRDHTSSRAENCHEPCDPSQVVQTGQRH